MPKGKLIVIEGTDGSGKRTQTDLLYKNLLKRRVKAAFLDIPVYESFTGELVARYLRNEFGRINPYLASTLFAVNRFQVKEKIDGWLKEGRIVIMNRYVSSNQTHQAANLRPQERAKFKKWVAKLEYEIFKMPRPDLVLFLNVPVEIATARVQHKSAKERKYAHGAAEDMLESDLVHQTAALREVLSLAKQIKNSRVITTMSGKRMMAKEEIANEIWLTVCKLLNLK